MTPAEYESKRSGLPYSQAIGDSSADRKGNGALGKLFGMTSSSGGLQQGQLLHKEQQTTLEQLVGPAVILQATVMPSLQVFGQDCSLRHLNCMIYENVT